MEFVAIAVVVDSSYCAHKLLPLLLPFLNCSFSCHPIFSDSKNTLLPFEHLHTQSNDKRKKLDLVAARQYRNIDD